ncbi:chemotaxis protein CheW [bacterium]|nr:MAG: chemotaxis protein CheW [bacterium]RKZ21964.1 MAG: chemotaxis protein CheW [bacterium]
MEGEMSELIVFTLKGEKFGIEIEKVREISEMVDVTRVPLAPPYVEGITNLRGEIVPIISLRKRFELGEMEGGEVILIEEKGKPVGFVVDKILGIVKVPKEKIKKVPRMMESVIETKYLKGVAQADKEKYIILDTEKIL